MDAKHGEASHCSWNALALQHLNVHLANLLEVCLDFFKEGADGDKTVVNVSEVQALRGSRAMCSCHSDSHKLFIGLYSPCWRRRRVNFDVEERHGVGRPQNLLVVRLLKPCTQSITKQDISGTGRSHAPRKTTDNSAVLCTAM